MVKGIRSPQPIPSTACLYQYPPPHPLLSSQPQPPANLNQSLPRYPYRSVSYVSHPLCRSPAGLTYQPSRPTAIWNLRINVPMLKMACKASPELTLQTLHCPLTSLPTTLSLTHSSPVISASLLPSTLPPQGLCTCYSLPLECFHLAADSCPHFLWAFAFSASLKSHTLMPPVHYFSHLHLFSS